MSVAPDDLWHYADSSKASDSEVQQRCSMSRAYYAAYHCCVSWHKNLPAPGSSGTGGGGMHQTLINQLRNPDATLDANRRLLSRSLGYTLQALKTDRELADYHLRDPIPQGKVAMMCATAKQVLDKAV